MVGRRGAGLGLLLLCLLRPLSGAAQTCTPTITTLTTVDVSWTAPPAQSTATWAEYVIDRKVDTGPWAEYARVPVTSLVFLDKGPQGQGLVPATYEYRVYATGRHTNGTVVTTTYATPAPGTQPCVRVVSYPGPSGLTVTPR